MTRWRDDTSSMLAFPKRKRAKRKTAWRGISFGTDGRPVLSEEALQEQCEQYLDARGLQWIHIPASALRVCSWDSPATIGQKREVSDYLKGVPDLMVFAPRAAERTTTTALLVELKVGRNKRTQAQERWAAQTNVCECRDFDTFRGLVDAAFFGMGG